MIWSTLTRPHLIQPSHPPDQSVNQSISHSSNQYKRGLEFQYYDLPTSPINTLQHLKSSLKSAITNIHKDHKYLYILPKILSSSVPYLILCVLLYHPMHLHHRRRRWCTQECFPSSDWALYCSSPAPLCSIKNTWIRQVDIISFPPFSISFSLFLYCAKTIIR